MFINEPRFRATAKTRCLALGFVFVLTASGVRAGVTPGYDCDVSNATNCECSLLTWAAHTERGSSCCDAPSPAQSTPAAAETGNSQRAEDSCLDVSSEREVRSQTRDFAPGEIDQEEPRTAAPHAYLLFCAFLT